jgi:hypothetical protein
MIIFYNLVSLFATSKVKGTLQSSNYDPIGQEQNFKPKESLLGLSPKYEVVGKVGMWHPFPNLGKCLLHPIRKNRTLKCGFNFESKS